MEIDRIVAAVADSLRAPAPERLTAFVRAHGAGERGAHYDAGLAHVRRLADASAPSAGLVPLRFVVRLSRSDRRALAAGEEQFELARRASSEPALTLLAVLASALCALELGREAEASARLRVAHGAAVAQMRALHATAR